MINEEQIVNELKIISQTLTNMDATIAALKSGSVGKTVMQEKELFPAVCSVCGIDCTVPFKPSANSKVKCKDCWNKARLA